MHAITKPARATGLIAAALVAAACQAGTATAPPTAPAGGTTPPAATIAVPSGGIVTFVPTAGATPQLQGGATLVGLSGKTEVVVALMAAGSETFAAAIQAGTCGSLNPEIAYRLTDVVSGASTTSLDVDVETLLATDYAVNIIVAGSETESSVACGNIEPVTVP